MGLNFPGILPKDIIILDWKFVGKVIIFLINK